MSTVVVLNKVLKVRDQEKQTAQLIYMDAMNEFEEVAKKLYEQLKLKETAEADFKTYIESEASIKMIKDQSNYIENIKQRILYLQNIVNEARNKMEEKQGILTEAHVEVKKIESVIETRVAEQIEHEKKQEMMSMDEISIRQYIDSN